MRQRKAYSFNLRELLAIIVAVFALAVAGAGQATSAKAELGSKTAKGGFRNESEIAEKFNNWRADSDAREWLRVMGYDPAQVTSVAASKPHGVKADVEVAVRTGRTERVEGISIKLVSGASGFNQIDKRWVADYARMWKMPPDVVEALRYFVGELPPTKRGRALNRMYLNELDEQARQAVIRFFDEHRSEIVSDLLEGDGRHAAKWLMVALRSTNGTRWTLRSTSEAAKFYGEGPVTITRSGNLRIGRITMQRKGGDGGRETAKMLQFKIDPALLFAYV